ncbi:MAG: hypothetical protein HDS99_03265 [Bacteroidales bacterium]|nr:hypothetical protein [Oscillospiraceae bacterium]MBD5182796.1 hypothetical protein [Bacteroidales bacterium]
MINEKNVNEKNKSKRENVNRGNDSSVYPKKTMEPQYLTYIAVDNKTTENGCVINKADIDAEICRRETNANEK